MAKARERPAWFVRMKRTTTFKMKIAEILRAWPTDGSSTSRSELDVEDAYMEWRGDMEGLPRVGGEG